MGTCMLFHSLLTWPARISTPVTDISLTSHDLADRKDNMICKQVTTRDNRYITQIMCFDKATISRQVSIEGVEELGKTQANISLLGLSTRRRALTLKARFRGENLRKTVWGWMPVLIGCGESYHFRPPKRLTVIGSFEWEGHLILQKKTVLVDLLTKENNMTSLHYLHIFHLLSLFYLPYILFFTIYTTKCIFFLASLTPVFAMTD